MLRDLKLDRINQELEDLEIDYQSVAQQLRDEQDGPTRNKLDRQLKEITQKIGALEASRNQYFQDQEHQSLTTMISGLLVILQNHEAIATDAIIASFQATLKTWRCPTDLSTNTFNLIVNKLILIPQGQQPYSALDEFISRLLEHDISLEFHTALVTWKTTHKPKLDTGELLRTLEVEASQRSRQYQPGLMIFIDRWEERSTQKKDDVYSVKAWLVEDVETYKTKQKLYRSLPCPTDIKADGLLQDNLSDRLNKLIQVFLDEVGDIVPNCRNMAEIHVFLPTELLHLPIDQGPLETKRGQTKYLGHDYVVVVRCTERYARSYRKRPRWLTQWEQHQALLDRTAVEVFEPISVVSEDFEDVVEQAADSEGTIGLRLTEPVEPDALMEVMDVLLDTGLPLAIWSRNRVRSAIGGCPLEQVLSGSCLRSLPEVVRKKRKDSSKKNNTPDCHIGHHLALLCDDPHLVPPKSA